MSVWNVSTASRSLIVARGRHGHFEWKPLIESAFVSSASRSLIISRVRHVFYGDSPLIKNKRYWFWNQISLSGMCKVLQGHFLWLEVRIFILVASLWYRSRDCDFEINFVYECMPSAWSILIISVFSHVHFGNLTLIQAKCLWFWN